MPARRNNGAFKAGRTGQSTLEYILVLAVVLLAVIAFASVNLSGNVGKTFNESGSVITEGVNRMNHGIRINGLTPDFDGG